MANRKQLEVHTGDQTPHKWCILGEEVFKRFIFHGSPTVHKVFNEGSLFSPLLFGKFFDPSDAFPLWEFESDNLLSNLRSSGRSTVDWFQKDREYVLKAELPGVGNNVQVFVDKGKVVEISGQWRQQGDQSKAKDWRSENWWEYGYVRRLELPEDADWRKIEAYVNNDILLEIRIPMNLLDGDPQGNVAAKDSEVGVGNNVQVFVDKGKVVEISGQWRQQGDQSKAKDWRSENWWEYGYVRMLELPEDADWRKIEAYVNNDILLEIRIPINLLDGDHPQGNVAAKESEVGV